MTARPVLLASFSALVVTRFRRWESASRFRDKPGCRGSSTCRRKGLRVWRRAMRCGRQGSAGLLRSGSPRTRRERPVVRGLPRRVGQLSAVTCNRRSAFSAAAVDASTPSGGGRSAIQADRRGRLPRKRRSGQRLQQSAAERAGSYRVPVAGEHARRRPGDGCNCLPWPTSGAACRR